jgi:predicted amidophosphoribosyltransferase
MNDNFTIRETSKMVRLLIKNPTKLCDGCMSEWTNFTLNEEKLCEECYKEKYVKTEVG